MLMKETQLKHLISFLKDRGNARVEVSCYDGSLKKRLS
jgi:hypothetical protein